MLKEQAEEKQPTKETKEELEDIQVTLIHDMINFFKIKKSLCVFQWL